MTDYHKGQIFISETHKDVGFAIQGTVIDERGQLMYNINTWTPVEERRGVIVTDDELDRRIRVDEMTEQ